MSCVTQRCKALQGVITPEMQQAAEEERRPAEFIRDEIAKGRAALPYNIIHKPSNPKVIGRLFKVKINVNLGVSEISSCLAEEIEKVKIAQKYGADAIMDLSVGKSDELDSIRREILAVTNVPLGTVPIYEVAAQVNHNSDITVDLILKTIEKQAKQGVDFMTIHAGILKEYLPLVENRVMGIVSRGGSILAEWMAYHNKQNPLYTHFDEILDIFREYDVTISLGDALRPGAIADSSDEAQFAELETLGELTLRAWEKGVQVLVEGPGHIPIHEIEMNVKKEIEVCHDAPFYVLGPVVTDVAPGYDHITSAIGAAFAGYAGAAMLCYVTPKEHLGLPNKEDLRVGTVTYKLTAHAIDIAKGIPGTADWDRKLSEARYNFDWETQFKLAIDSERAREYFYEDKPHEYIQDPKYCAMCGPKYCAIATTQTTMDIIKEFSLKSKTG